LIGNWSLLALVLLLLLLIDDDDDDVLVGATLSNRMGIGMISSSVVHQVNTHRFTESDF